MNSLKEDNPEDDEEIILAGEGQGDEDLEEKDKHSSIMYIHDLQEKQLIEFWASMTEDKRRRSKNMT